MSKKELDNDVVETLYKRANFMNLYVLVMVIVAIMIVLMSVKVSKQVQQYRQDYKMLQDMKSQYRKLQVEHQRLLIEQQTFSAMPVVANRAVHELGMRLPSSKDKLILQPGSDAQLSVTLPSNQQAIIKNLGE